MRRLALLFALLASAPALGQTGSLEDRIWGELRATRTQLDAANAQLAPAQARADAAEKALAALKAKCAAKPVARAGPDAADRARIAALESEVASARAKAAAGESAQTAAQAQVQAQMVQDREALAAMRAERDRAVGAARAQTAAATQAAAQLDTLKAKNLRLVALAREILDHYSHVGLGTVVAAHEPFLGRARVRIENEAEVLGDRVYENRYDARGALRPSAKPPAADTSKP